MPPYEVRRYIGLNRVQPHHFLDEIVQREVDKIDLHDPRKSLGKVTKELIKVPLRGDRLCHFEESLIPLRKILTGGDRLPVHKQTVWTIP